MTQMHSVIDGIEQGWIARKIRKSLTEVNGLVLSCQCRHGGEDGGTNVWQFGGKPAFRCKTIARMMSLEKR
jgi:hypothetical protein